MFQEEDQSWAFLTLQILANTSTGIMFPFTTTFLLSSSTLYHVTPVYVRNPYSVFQQFYKLFLFRKYKNQIVTRSSLISELCYVWISVLLTISVCNDFDRDLPLNVFFPTNACDYHRTYSVNIFRYSIFC